MIAPAGRLQEGRSIEDVELKEVKLVEDVAINETFV